MILIREKREWTIELTHPCGSAFLRMCIEASDLKIIDGNGCDWMKSEMNTDYELMEIAFQSFIW